ncbi:unnamed protein product [Mesocestoides corti]|uniref:Uncharacterized protein n=2 Tax=Mesocestoides corti TaxID=53468 RepID=A0A0R3UF30_MESCO|nr:unnamed protein product [Mesocestoides corti]
MEQSPKTSTLDPKKWPQFEGQWRHRTKFSFFENFIKEDLAVPWQRYFVACQFNGQGCPGLRVDSVSAPLVGVSSDSGAPFLGTSHWTLDPGRLYGYLAPQDPDQLKKLKTGTRNKNRTRWPQHPLVALVTAAKYQCFQIRMQTTSVKRSGSRSGLHLILKRPYPRNLTHPALLFADDQAGVYQGWDDHKGPAAANEAQIANELDGVQVMLHDAPEADSSSLPTGSVASTSGSRSSVRTSVRYGHHIVVTLTQFIHERLDTYFRPCKKNIFPIQYLDLKAFIKDNKKLFVEVDYTRSNCLAALRQSVMQRKCQCLSEESMVPFYLADELEEAGFCHSPKKMQVNHTMSCHDEVLKMSDEEILEASLPKKWYRVVLVPLKQITKYFWLCPQPCVERVNEIDHQQTLPLSGPLPQDLLESVGLNVSEASIDTSDYLVVTVAAARARIPVMSEGESASFFNLLAALGGMFGLFLGLSGVTMFEVIEAHFIVLSHGYGVFRHAFKVGLGFGKKMLERKKSPEDGDDDGELDDTDLQQSTQLGSVPP